jgi:hypothetical protein
MPIHLRVIHVCLLLFSPYFHISFAEFTLLMNGFMKNTHTFHSTSSALFRIHVTMRTKCMYMWFCRTIIFLVNKKRNCSQLRPDHNIISDASNKSQTQDVVRNPTATRLIGLLTVCVAIRLSSKKKFYTHFGVKASVMQCARDAKTRLY